MKIKGRYSDPKIITSGIPQGSILGLVLFTIYINDIFNLAISRLYCLLLYAKDSTCIVRGSNIAHAIAITSSALEELSLWCHANHLKLNNSKTTLMIFSLNTSQIASCPETIKTSTLEINRVDHLKLLGIYFDSKLTFKTHCHYLNGKLPRAIATLHKLQYLVNR